MEEILTAVELEIRIRALESVRMNLRADNQDRRAQARDLPTERTVRACNEALALLYAERRHKSAGFSELRRRNG